MTRTELQALLESMRDEFQDVEFSVTRRRSEDGNYLVRCRVRVSEEVGIEPHESVEEARRHLQIHLDNLLGSTSEAARRLYAADRVVEQLSAMIAAQPPAPMMTATPALPSPSLWDHLAEPSSDAGVTTPASTRRVPTRKETGDAEPRRTRTREAASTAGSSMMGSA
jgi:hypothetical protein